MIQLSKKYTFMEPEIACKETGFEGRSDIILYYDMLNRITNFSKLNELIKKYNIRSLLIRRGFDSLWNEKSKHMFFKNVNLKNITEFFASSNVNYEEIIQLCPNITTIEIHLKNGQNFDISKAKKLKYFSIFGFNGTNLRGIKEGSSIQFWGKRGEKFEFPNSLPRKLNALGFIYYKSIDLDSLNLEYLESFDTSYGGKKIKLSPKNKFIPYLKTIDIKNGDCSFINASFIESAKSLEKLMIENCTPINSLKGIVSLNHVSITGTDILDKDLTPLKSCKYVNVTDKKGFNIKNKDLPKN